MKKTLLAMLLMLMLCIGLAVTANATGVEYPITGTCGTNVTWSLDNNGTLTISGTGAMAEYGSGNLPAWNSYNGSITQVVIVKGVTSIGSYAFNKHKELTSITIPDSVTSINTSAFYECKGLTDITIPASVTSINQSAFSACSNLKTVTIKGNLAKIGDNAFEDCESLETVTINGYLTEIGGYVFMYCSNLKTVTIKGNLAKIGDNAFAGCSSLNTFIYKGTVKPIAGFDVFASCSSLKKISVPANYNGNEFAKMPILREAVATYQFQMQVIPTDSDASGNIITNGSATAVINGVTFADGNVQTCTFDVGSHAVDVQSVPEGYVMPGSSALVVNANGTLSAGNEYIHVQRGGTTENIIYTIYLRLNQAQSTTYNVSVSANPPTGGTVTGGGTYGENKTATVTATANPGYQFVCWMENGEPVANADASYNFTVEANRILVAVFVKLHTITVNLDGGALTTEGSSKITEYNQQGYGIVVDSDTDTVSANVPDNTRVVLELADGREYVSKSGYTLVGFKNSTGEEYKQDTTTITVSENEDYTLLWEQNPYTVKVIPDENMILTPGTGNADQSVNAGSAMTNVVCTAKEGYYFPTDYTVAAVNGIIVTRNSFTQITVSGTPTADVELMLVAATTKAQEAKPMAEFVATGDTTGTLSSVASGMQYKINNGEWMDISATSIDLISLNACTISVVKKGGDTTLDSDAQTITITKAAAPAGITAIACTTIANNDGKLANVTNVMEYKKSDATAWVGISGSEITGLEAGTYNIRVKANGTGLASDAVTLTVGSYVASTNAGVSEVKVKGVEGTISGTNVAVILPYGTDLSALNATTDFAITLAETKAIVDTPVSSNGGATWTFTVTAESGATQNYTVNITIGEDPNKDAKAAIGNHNWTAAQATANTSEALKTWIESELAALNLNSSDVSNVTVTPFVPAVAGDMYDLDGTNGSFSFAVELKKGNVTDTVTVTNGVITATRYTGEAFVPVTGITGVPTSATAGVPVELSGVVAPNNATFQTIVWSVKDAGTTGASISGNTLSATAAGDVVITATIENGKGATEAYTQDFTIAVDVVLTSITVTTPPTKTVYTDGERFNPAGMVIAANYSNGTSKTIANYAVSPSGMLSTANTAITISYTEDGVTKTITQAIKVNAKTYRVTFNANGGSGEMTAQTFTEGKAQALKANEFTRKNFYFTGWNTAADGSGEHYANKAEIKVSEDTTLYAQWARVPSTTSYTVQYNANGGTGSVYLQAFTSSMTFELRMNEFVREGYKFVGWNTKADGTGDAYAEGASFSGAIKKSIILYAQWKLDVPELPAVRPEYKIEVEGQEGKITRTNDTSIVFDKMYIRWSIGFDTVDGPFAMIAILDVVWNETQEGIVGTFTIPVIQTNGTISGVNYMLTTDPNANMVGVGEAAKDMYGMLIK